MKKLLSLSLVLILVSGFFAGCKKDKGNPPVLPPAESMTIDFSNFDTQKKSLEVVAGQKGTENSNFVFAASVAVIWKLIITSAVAVPVASFKLAVDQTPVYLSKNNWQWSYNVTVAGASYKARLTGQTGSSDVTWKMYVTKDGTGGFTDFLWFQGTSKLDGSGGQWTLNESSTAPNAILQIDWTKTGASVGKVKYTYVKSGPLSSGYIEYGLTSNPLNAYYTIHYYNGVKFSDVNVEWNTTTHNGRVKSPDYLLDTNWYCWGSNKVNVTCP
jgi:hypothetical protein